MAYGEHHLWAADEHDKSREYTADELSAARGRRREYEPTDSNIPNFANRTEAEKKSMVLICPVHKLLCTG